MIQAVLQTIALALEVVSALVVALGALTAVLSSCKGVLTDPSGMWKRRVWLDFAAWIVLALEFALGADVIRTTVAPTWEDLGKLAALASVRTGLNYFLSRDLDKFGVSGETAPAGARRGRARAS